MRGGGPPSTRSIMEPPHGGWRVVGLSSDTEESISEGLSAKATEPPLRTAARSQPGGRLREHAFASSREAFFLVKLRNHLKTKHSDLQKKEKKKKDQNGQHVSSSSRTPGIFLAPAVSDCSNGLLHRVRYKSFDRPETLVCSPCREPLSRFQVQAPPWPCLGPPTLSSRL